VTPFHVTLGEIGVFPRWSQPRVLWVGLGEGEEEVKSLAYKVEEAMAHEGFEKEKRSFSAHLTLGRVRSPKNKDKLEKIASMIMVKPVRISVSRVVLFESHLSREGATYTQLKAPLFTG
jgi:2'-5' RNA ligase